MARRTTRDAGWSKDSLGAREEVGPQTTEIRPPTHRIQPLLEMHSECSRALRPAVHPSSAKSEVSHSALTE